MLPPIYCMEKKSKFFGLVDPAANRDACGVGFIASCHNLPSHKILEKTFEALDNLAHRGAIDADGKTGDGAGILLSIPKDFFLKKADEAGIDLGEGHFAVAMIFYPPRAQDHKDCQKTFHHILKQYGIHILWERDVPVNDSVLGDKAASLKPYISQTFLSCPKQMTRDEFEQALFLIRKQVESTLEEHSYHDFYVASMSGVSLVYKGLFMGADLKAFYKDLQDPDFISSYAVFHQRFSTNTFPTWGLAQPFRMMAHNGEINTIKGNRNWMVAREYADQAQLSWVPGDYSPKKFIMAGRSDSASFDNALETYFFGGRTLIHSVIHMMPEAWQNQHNMDEDLKAFYEYHACISESWGGPAAIAFSDGNIVGATLDRNGLRPLRYKITTDYLFACSEMGCVRFDEADVLENGKLSPGTLLAINLKRKKILKNDDIKFNLADQRPYAAWVEKRVYKIDEAMQRRGKNLFSEKPFLTDDRAQLLQKVFGYSQEDLDLILHPMFRLAKEPVGSMGDDTPLAVFSQKPKLLYSYFKQLFAQVTNPPIDPIRERYVTSLRMYLGASGNIFEESHQHAHQIRVRSPIVSQVIFDEIKRHPHFPSATISTHFPVVEGPETIEDAVLSLCMACEKAVDDGKMLIILSDRYVDKDRAPIPMLLAVASVHHHLIRTGKRLKISLLVDTGEARETHHFACLIGYGASLIYPYLALKTAEMYANDPKNQISVEQAVENYLQACQTGLLKIMSKMGISVLQSYHAAQLFEVIGLKTSVAKFHFGGTPSKISGADLSDIAEDYLFFHSQAFENKSDKLDVGGLYRFRRQGEYHAFNPDVVKSLQKAVIQNDPTAYKEFSQHVAQRPPMTIRDLLSLKPLKKIDLQTVESADDIVKRFCTPGISYGAISKETHETFAIAMNRIGAKSDSGEGGEDPQRYQKDPAGDRSSAIKQVASGRFGVTAHYLSQAKELEIKIAQGAKPGEGGQLPGHKVSVEIAAVRHSIPGVTLISPPPHHDIYSIEDLAQLIYDLKQINPKAHVCVKLVAEDGIGTIAAGVAKAHADVILISGHDGGTGASPLSSVKNAGAPWELGLAEVQQVLVQNRLRERVRLRVDGGLKTGLDVVKAALLGAEEFGFGTGSMVAVGCVMVRQCHLNTCPVGIATQKPDLRKKYKGTPERLINYFLFVAQEVRELLSDLGFKSLQQAVGRVDCLQQIKSLSSSKISRIRLSRLLADPSQGQAWPLSCRQDRNDWDNDVPFDLRLIKESSEILKLGQGQLHLQHQVRNIHRSVGAQLSYEVVSRFGPQGLPEGQIVVDLKGTVGQSFAVYGMRSLVFHLEGEANDYVAKGLSGATVSLRPPKVSRFLPEHNVICGNTCLYGATAGKLFVNGRAGERFAVRNSGALAVVEGVGDHGCEYMTGGAVLILGPVGHNFGAGMTGGLAYVYDGEKDFESMINAADVTVLPVDWSVSESQVFLSLLNEHFRLTESPLAKKLLDNWEIESSKFVRVLPKESLKQGQIEAQDSKTLQVK